jgi:hypothetical protein
MAPLLSSAPLDMQFQTTEAGGDFGNSDSKRSGSVLSSCTGALPSL